MLTLGELESTLQIEYELQLEALGEQALRELLADEAALGRLIPGHISYAEGRRIAEVTLAELIAKKKPVAAPSAQPATSSPWGQLFSLFSVPFRW
jgi:hypothetical protein